MKKADKIALAKVVLGGYAIKRFKGMQIHGPNEPGFCGWYWKRHDTGWIGAFKTQWQCVEDAAMGLERGWFELPPQPLHRPTTAPKGYLPWR